MTGPRLFHSQRQDNQDQPGPVRTASARSRTSRMLSWFLAVSTGTSTLAGMNINNLGANVAMAQTGSDKVTVVAEDTKAIQKQAAQAADAFKRYIITGDESHRERFWEIYNKHYKDTPFNELTQFMKPFRAAMDKVVNDPLVVPIYNAFKANAPLGPHVYTDFIDAVHAVRSALASAMPSKEDVDALVARVKMAEGKLVKAYDPIAKVRDKVADGRDVTGAARWVLMEEDLEVITSRYGKDLVDALRGSIPKERAAMAVDALKNYVLTGDQSEFGTFDALWDANSSNETFIKEMTDRFREQIYHEKEGGKPTDLSRVVQSFNAAVGLEPGEFAEFVKDMYDLAARPNATLDAVDAKLVEYVNGIDPKTLPEGMTPANAISKLRAEVLGQLLDIVAKGKASQAIEYMREVLQTGDAGAAAQFVRLYDSTFLGEPIDKNDVFFTEFNRLYKEEIRQSEKAKPAEEPMALRTLVADFERNVLPIAVRDIYTELLKTNPDRDGLETRYGQDFVDLVASRMASGELGWMVRDGTELNTQLERRVAMDDSTAISVKNWNIADKTGALSKIYGFLAREIATDRPLSDYVTLDQNFEQLSWLSGTPQQVQRQLTSKMQRQDAFAIAFLAHHNGNAQQAAEALSPMYAQLRQLRQDAGITENGLVALVASNMDAFQWVAKPVSLIGKELEQRRYEQVVAGIHQTAGFAYGTMAMALKEIYGGTQDRAGMVTAYGEELVALVEANRESLGWLSGDVKSIENGLRTRKDDVTKALKRYIRSYNAPEFVESVATARTAALRPGAVRADALDALGYSFLESAAAKEAEIREPITGEGLEDRRTVLEARWKMIDDDITDIESQLNYPILEPAKGLLFGKMTRWRAENERIRTDARSADGAELERLEKDQETLMKGMVNPQELRKSVEMAFALIHMSETGTDISGMVGSATTGTMGTLLTWYGSLDEVVGGKEKQAVIGDVVSAVLEKARPELSRFIGSMNERGFFQAITATYAMAEGRGGSDRLGLVNAYGAEFVSMVEMQAANLGILESVSISQQGMLSFQMAKNDLFAAITIRCYRAITNPRGTENKELMVQLFGKGLVAEVEKNKNALEQLGRAGAGLSDVLTALNGLDGTAQAALWDAYAGAYKKSVGSLMRLYRHQNEALFDATTSIYGVLIRAPREGAPKATREEYDKKVKSLRDRYGDKLVKAVQSNREALGFLESPMATVDKMRELDGKVLDALHNAFEAGPGLSRTNFMVNFRHVADRIPRIYLQLRNAMLYNNPTDKLGINFNEAVQLYRQEFGYNDYLFNQYVNLPLFNENLQKLSKRGTVPATIKTPEELAGFLSSATGQQMIVTGRRTFEAIKTEYLMQRQRQNFSPETGDFTNDSVTTLTNELSILDALYIGIALQEIQGTKSSFGPMAATEFMNTLLVIAHRDPYLVGPYIMQVLPALINVSQDEETLLMGMTAFRTIFTTRYGEGLRNMSYSTAIIRQYFLDYFGRIDEKLPEIVSLFDHSNLEDELRQHPDPRTDEGYLNPYLYRYKPGWWQYQGDTIPMLYGQPGEPLNLLPQPTMPTAPYNPVPGRGLILDSDAMGLFSRISDQLAPPTDRMFNFGVPARFRIGAIGESTIIRRLNELAGPMPVDYQDYWLSKQAELGMFYAAEGAEVKTSDTTTGVTESQGGGGGVAGVVRGITGGAQAVGTVEGTTTTTKQVTTESVTGATQEGPPSPAYSTTTWKADVTGQAGGVPGQPVPLPLLGLYPGDVFKRGNEVGIHNAQQEFHYESTSGTMEVPGTDVEGGPETKEVKTAEKTSGLLSTYQRIAKENKTDMLLFVSGEYVPELRGPARKDITLEDLSGMGVEDANMPPSTDNLNQDLYDMDHGEDAQAKQEAADRANQALEAMGITMDDVNEAFGKREGEVMQKEEGRMKSRLYFITEEGNVYNLAYGYDTESQLSNYLFAGLNRQEALASFKFIGRDMWAGLPLSDAEYRQRAADALDVDQADLSELSRSEIKNRLKQNGIKEDQITKGVAGGFDGAALGFTVPAGNISDDDYREGAAVALNMNKSELDKMSKEDIGKLLKKKGISEKQITGGDAYSALAFGELVRNLETLDPVHAEQAVGMAVTNLLDSKAQRDIYAAFYRGAEIVELKEDDRTKLDTDKTKHAETSVEVMWRRMRINPMEKSWELRAVGGYPTTVGVMGKLESPQGVYHMHGYGATAAWTEMDLLREFRAIDTDAEGVYSNVKSMLVQLYGYTEDEAANRGLLISADYMYGRLEDRITSMSATEAQKQDLTQHYATLLMMAWADRHGFLIGGQRVPGYTNMNNSINQAMLEIQSNPTGEAEILKDLASELRNQFEESIWRFSLGYGYDGETIRLYTVASAEFPERMAEKTEAQKQQEELEGPEAPADGKITGMPENITSGNLYSLFLFGRPTEFYAELGTHFYGQSPLVITRDSDPTTGEPTGPALFNYDEATPFVDLWGGFGVLDYPSMDLMRYEKKVTIRSEADAAEALRDAYREVGSSTANDQRITHLYGGAVVDAVAEGKESLDWMVRPVKEIADELKKKVEEEDPVARSTLSRRYGDRMAELTKEDYSDAAEMIRDIYIELRKTHPDVKRLQGDHGAEVVDVVASHAMDLDWVLLPQNKLSREFDGRARKEGTVENAVAEHMSFAAPAHGTKLTGTEVQRLCEHNLVQVVVGITDSENAIGIGADKYDIILASNLRDEEEDARTKGEDLKRRDTFYVLMSPAAASPNSKGSVVIGNDDDLREWNKNGFYIGRGVARLDIKPDEVDPKDYNFVFSGDRRLTLFNAEKIVGGITLPLEGAEYDRYHAENNWTLGGIVNVLQDHQNDWLAGALYGVRQYGDVQWDQITVTTSLRHQLTNTATYSDQVYWYMFFNRMTQKVVLATKDVWEDEAQLRQVCSMLGGCDMNDLKRTTGGAGVTWAKTDIMAGRTLSLHFFFEGGTEERRQHRVLDESANSNVVADMLGQWSGTEFVFRSGAAVSYQRQAAGSVLGEIYTLGITGARGSWPIVPGQITRPEYLNVWANDLGYMGWWLMLYGQIQW